MFDSEKLCLITLKTRERDACKKSMLSLLHIANKHEYDLEQGKSN